MPDNKNKILLVLPHNDFDDNEFNIIQKTLNSSGIKTEIASSHLSEAQGKYKSIVIPDVLINFVEAGDYTGFIFIGEESASEYFSHSSVLRIIDQAHYSHKLIAAIGAAVPILGYTGKLSGEKVTSTERERRRLEELGTIFTGRQIESSNHFVTASGPEAIEEFAKTIVEMLNWTPRSSERIYLR